MLRPMLLGVLVCLGALGELGHSEVVCRNDKGQEVDWYILYKFPKLNGTKGDGLNYLYMDANTNGWRLSREKINSRSGSVANTLVPLFDFYKRKTEGFGYILYNDQPPKPRKPAPQSFGHCKGFVMMDKATGVWMSHSTPHFPLYQTEDFWPSSGKANAQTFLCVTYRYAEFKNIGVHLKYMHAYPYDYYLPTLFHEELKCVAQKSCYPKSQPWFKVFDLTSKNGYQFKTFAKYSRFQNDLYDGLVVNFTNEDLFVKSWGKMHQPLPSNCSKAVPHHVFNVEEVNLESEVSFYDTADHSKWCVTPSGSFSCVSDMNREVSQKSRGGGAVCTRDLAVGEAFFQSIKTIKKPQRCDSPQLLVENLEL